MRRVVITGMGLVSPLACGVEESWKRLLDGQSGAAPIDAFDVSDLPCRIACNVKLGDGSDGTFNPEDWVPSRELRRIDTFIIFAMAAAEQAIADAKLVADDGNDSERVGVMIGSGIGGLASIEKTTLELAERGPRKVSPFFIPGSLINLCSGQVAIRHGFKGPNHAVVTACSTGAHAIGDAARIIKYGSADVMVAGGSEAAICRIGMAGFAACKALSTGFNDDPARGSRPYDADRDGFVMGEGAGVVVLEEYEHAVARGCDDPWRGGGLRHVRRCPPYHGTCARW